MRERTNQELLELAFSNILSQFSWGNYCFYMTSWLANDLVMVTVGGEEDDYDEINNEAIMSVIVNDNEIFQFKYDSDDKFQLMNVIDEPLTRWVLISLIKNEFKTESEL